MLVVNRAEIKFVRLLYNHEEWLDYAKLKNLARVNNKPRPSNSNNETKSRLNYYLNVSKRIAFGIIWMHVMSIHMSKTYSKTGRRTNTRIFG